MPAVKEYVSLQLDPLVKILKNQDVSKESRRFFVVWHDYEDDCSHGMAIDIKQGEEPFERTVLGTAMELLDNHIGKESMHYIESLTELSDDENPRRF